MSLIVVLTNTSNLAPVSDYTYEVLVGDGTKAGSHTITKGTVKGHVRAAGWKVLVGKLLESEDE